MGKFKEQQIEQEEQERHDAYIRYSDNEEQVTSTVTDEEQQAANQEAYYWHLLHEFVAINKFFGQTKVMADLKMIRERLQAEEDKNKPRIQLL